MQINSQKIPEPKPSLRSKWLPRLQAALRRVGPIVALLLLVLIAAFIGARYENILFPTPTPLTQENVDQSIFSAMASATPSPANSTLVYQVILPSLVLIQTQDENHTEGDGVGIGSGVVISAGGDILTALHVVDGAQVIQVFFADGTQSAAAVLATDPKIDIAVLRPVKLPSLIVPAVLGNPNAMRIGDEAFAVGNPLGLAGSLSAGVISGFDRSFTIDKSGVHLEGLIQFDAAVNPGNSGGPLLNRAGQVIGIVTAIASPSEQVSFSGIGFAVPITTAGGAAGAPNQ